MSAPSYIVKAVDALIATLPEDHRKRIMAAVTGGPRIKLADLAKAKGVTRRTVWRWITEGKLPRPRKDGRRTNTWAYSEVEAMFQ